MELGFEDCDQYASDLMRAKEYLLELETSGEETLRAVIEQTRREIADYRHKLTDCAQRYLAEKGW